jgi:hypothetical protein
MAHPITTARLSSSAVATLEHDFLTPASARKPVPTPRFDWVTSRIVWLSLPDRCTARHCCARAMSGHAAAPPNSVLNSRRLMG